MKGWGNRLFGFTVLGCAVLFASCASDDGDAKQDVRSNGDRPSASDGLDSEQPDGSSLVGASVDGADGAVWRAGGLFPGSSGSTWEPNRSLEAFTVSGEPRTRMSVPLPDGTFISLASVIESSNGTLVIVANECPVLATDEIGCADPSGSIYIADSDSELRRIGLPRLSGDAAGFTRFIGEHDGLIWMSRVTGAREDIPYTTHSTVLSFDPSDHRFSRVDVPDGVLTDRSVCASSVLGLVASVPALEPDGTVTKVELFRYDSSSATWQSLSTSPPVNAGASGGGILCASSTVAVLIDNFDGSTLLVFEDTAKAWSDSKKFDSQVISWDTTPESIALGLFGFESHKASVVKVLAGRPADGAVAAISNQAEADRPYVVVVNGQIYDGRSVAENAGAPRKVGE